MRIAVHQPHYFPWLGYLDKMAKVDKFILLDCVQLTGKSNMFRNKFLSSSGKDKYLTVSFIRKEYMEKQYREVELNKTVDWQKDHINFILTNYKKSHYFNEVWTYVSPVFYKDYQYVCDVAIDSLTLLKNMLGIKTELVLQSTLNYDTKSKNNDLMLNICKVMSADEYLSGNGARKYMKLDVFKENNIDVAYQEFQHPVYTQCNSEEFIPNLSTLDILFNCGIDKTREVFWNIVKNTHEFSEENGHD